MVYKYFKWFAASLLIGLAPIAHAAPLRFLPGTAIHYPHPFFISITEINHNRSEQLLEISCKVFFDDLEKVLAAQNKTAVDITNPKDKQQVNKMIGTYLQQHLKLKVDGKAVTLVFLGYEREREAAWCYLQVEQVAAIKKLEVFNNIFYEQFETQINLVHAIVSGNRKSTRLNNPQANASFEF